MNTVGSDTLVVIGGWGVRCEMLSGLYERWPGEVIPVSLNDELMAGCDSVSAVADELLGRFPKPAVWMGWSQGSQIAMAAAARNTGAVTSLVTVGGFPRFTETAGWPSGMPQGEFEAFARGIARDPDRYWMHFLLLMINGDAGEGRARERLKFWLKQGPPVSGENLVKGLDWLRKEDFRSLWGSPGVPALHLMGEQDVVVRPWRERSELSGQSCAGVISGMAHWPTGEAADECQQVMAEFLAGTREVGQWTS
ncbi:alpha/beta fold hydrolase [Marinobacter sp. DUT-3]|uniref:alpha/beta fold hydrolase n=1 Tax=Marinobacter sp. DUT-3 TaxID=3412036 RepID=UPI003D17795F